MLWWSKKKYKSLKDIARVDGQGWRTFAELLRQRCTRVAPPLYTRVIHNIPWDARPMPSPTIRQWLAIPEEDNSIHTVFQLQHTDPPEATMYHKDPLDQLRPLNHKQPLLEGRRKVQIVRSRGPKWTMIDLNPREELEPDQSLWLWGNNWLCDLEWEPKEWNWRRIGTLAETTIMNYTTKRGYRVALRQDNNQMNVNVVLEAIGFINKDKAKFFNRI